MTIKNLTSATLYILGYPLKPKKSIELLRMEVIPVLSDIGCCVMNLQPDDSIKISYNYSCKFLSSEDSTRDTISFIED